MKRRHSGPDKPAYRNPKLPVERRVKDLLSRMTLKEKAAQMLCIWQQKSSTLVDETGQFRPAKSQDAFQERLGLGQVGRPSDAGGGRNAREMAELTNAIQKFFIENSRLGIPVIFHEECLHGHAAIDGTSFSQPIGLGATFDPELVRRLVRDDGRGSARPRHAPGADAGRGCRARAALGTGRGNLRRGSLSGLPHGDRRRAGIPGRRHFQRQKARHRHAQAFRRPRPAGIRDQLRPGRTSRSAFCARFSSTPFKQAIQKGGAISVMASYNEIDGVPSHANKWLLRDVLRKEWGFKGYVVSDYFAIRELNERPELFGNHLAEDGKQAAALAVKGRRQHRIAGSRLLPASRRSGAQGRFSRNRSSMSSSRRCWPGNSGWACSRIPTSIRMPPRRIVGCEAHRELALQAARETITLLKNDGGLAPLDPNKIKTIAVIGPNADRQMLGGYSGVPKHCTTLLQGIRDRAGDSVNVLYHEGCKITIGGSWQQDEVVPEQSGRGSQEHRRGGQGRRNRPMSWSWPSAATSRPRAKPGR